MKDPRHARSTYHYLIPFIQVVDNLAEDVRFDSFMRHYYEPVLFEKLGWGVPTFGGVAYRITQVNADNMPKAIFSVRHDRRTIVPVTLLRNENEFDNSRCAYQIQRSVFWETWNGVNPDQLVKQDEFLWQWAKSLKVERGIFPSHAVVVS